jgi:SAM-dependent methyltransferase
MLDVGSGPARHATLLAQATGAHCICLDASAEMLEYAGQRAAASGVRDKLTLVNADMASEDGFLQLLPAEDATGGSVDLSTVMLGTLSHCLDNATALRCFANIAAAVKPGGLLVVEVAHPEELLGGAFLDPGRFVECWEVGEDGRAVFADEAEGDDDDDDDDGEDIGDLDAVSGRVSATSAQKEKKEHKEERNDVDVDEEEEEEGQALVGKRVLVEYGREGDAFDPGTQILRRTVGLSLFEGSELASSVVETVPQRQFTLQEIDLLAKATGWEVAATYGDLDASVGLLDERAYRLVVVLKRCC